MSKMTKVYFGVLHEHRDGLYYFQRILHVYALKIDGAYSLDLWHKQMRHPSMKTTKLVPAFGSSGNSMMLNKACDVCQRAKHTRDKFPLVIIKLAMFLTYSL